MQTTRQDCAELAAQAAGGVNQLPETVSVLQTAAADGNQPNADANIGERVQRPLHRVGDREIGVFPLIKMADQEDATEEPDHLDDRLDDGEIADDAGAIKSTADNRRR